VGLTAARNAGLKVMRTWGFNDKNKTYIPFADGGLPQYYVDTTGTYFQEFDDKKITINYGSDGLLKLDNVVKAAEATDIKLVVTLTNNWADYGGMDMYTINLGYKYHDEFYTQPEIINAFKAYVKAVVTRYKDSPAIFSWELANEPRCDGDGTRNLPRSANCTASTLNTWMAEISKYIKSLDPEHMVTTGSEGFFNDPSSDDWAYNGSDGVDFYAETGIPTIDYGCFHLYPDWWSKTPQWGTQYIIDHAKAQRALKKPVVFEEYGWLSPAARLSNLGTVSNYTRLEVLGSWQQTSIEERLAGDQYWQYGFYWPSYGPNNDDGFTIYLNDSDARVLVYEHARRVSELNYE